MEVTAAQSLAGVEKQVQVKGEKNTRNAKGV
jgi:hypothetical protein